MFEDIRPHAQITFLIPNGIGRDGVEYKRKTGRAVMHGPAGWVVNGGGPHGTPYVVTEANYLHHKNARA